MCAGSAWESRTTWTEGATLLHFSPTVLRKGKALLFQKSELVDVIWLGPTAVEKQTTVANLQQKTRGVFGTRHAERRKTHAIARRHDGRRCVRDDDMRQMVWQMYMKARQGGETLSCTFLCPSLLQTQRLARWIAQKRRPGIRLMLQGSVGSGKSEFRSWMLS